MDMINLGNIMLNNYLLKIPTGYMAIDTGYAGNFDRFCKGLKEKDIELKKIRYIFLTHAHDDHAGFLGKLLQETEASAIMHKDSPQRLALGHNLSIGGCPTALAKAFFGLMGMVGKGNHEFPAVDVSGKQSFGMAMPNYFESGAFRWIFLLCRVILPIRSGCFLITGIYFAAMRP